MTNIFGSFAGKNIPVRVEALNVVYNLIKCCIKWERREIIADLVYKFGIFFQLVDKVLLKIETCTIL